MAHTHIRMLKAPGVVVALAAAFALTGCFGSPGGGGDGGMVKDGAEKLVEEMSEGETEIELDGEIPDNFPDSVPLIDATVESAMYLDLDDDGEATKGWTVSMATEDGRTAVEQARQLLLDAGFEETVWKDPEGIVTGIFTNAEFTVSLAAVTDRGRVTYTVIPMSGDE